MYFVLCAFVEHVMMLAFSAPPRWKSLSCIQLDCVKMIAEKGEGVNRLYHYILLIYNSFDKKANSDFSEGCIFLRFVFATTITCVLFTTCNVVIYVAYFELNYPKLK